MYRAIRKLTSRIRSQARREVRDKSAGFVLLTIMVIITVLVTLLVLLALAAEGVIVITIMPP